MNSYSYNPQMNMGMQYQNRYMNTPNMNMLEQQQQPMMVNNASISNQQPFLIVSNIQEAKEKVLQYNSTIWMRDSSEPYLYVKSVDATGNPSFHAFRLEDVTSTISTNGNNIQQQVDYVSTKDFNELNTKVEQLQQNMSYYSSVLQQIATQQQDKSADIPQEQGVIDVEAKEVKKFGRIGKVGGNNA